MNDSTEELANLYVLDRLDAQQRGAFEQQLARDPALLALVRELESVFAQRVRALPQHRPSDRVLERIHTQITEETAAKSRSPGTSRAPWARWAPWAMAAAAVIGVSVFGARWLRSQGATGKGSSVLLVSLDAKGTSVQMLRLPKETPDADARFVELASMAERFSESREIRPVGTAAGSETRSYALFDPHSRQGFIVLRELPKLPEGKRYCIWVVDTRSRVVEPAGVIPQNGEQGVYFFNLEGTRPLAADRADFLVTAEDAKGSTAVGSQPKGKVVLGKDL